MDQTVPDCRLVVQRLRADAIVPYKANPSDACYDLATPEAVVLSPRSTSIVDLGLAIELQAGWEAQVRGRSGLSTRGIVVHPGTIDHLYRLALKIIVHNISDSPHTFEVGQRIAQLKIERVWNVELIEGNVTPTTRGGLGSTG